MSTPKSTATHAAIPLPCRGTIHDNGGQQVAHTHLNGRRVVPLEVEAGDYFCVGNVHWDSPEDCDCAGCPAKCIYRQVRDEVRALFE